ncbi:MAG: flavin reductase family protein [Alicyclobacillaceae bacterium]|nr:flavin reductase family protein [Alicyclobacillaceae bacterium]
MQSAFDSMEFRRALGCFATGVTVITTPTDEGAVHGMTANAFTSVSLEPPLVLVSVDRKTRTHGLIASSGRFAVNILREDQAPVSQHFAGKPNPDVEQGLAYAWYDDIPYLEDCLASLACKLWASYDGGDHTLYLGEVLNIVVRDGDPLLFFRSKYRQIQP